MPQISPTPPAPWDMRTKYLIHKEQGSRRGVTEAGSEEEEGSNSDNNNGDIAHSCTIKQKGSDLKSSSQQSSGLYE
jgi:hypothetical protein